MHIKKSNRSIKHLLTYQQQQHRQQQQQQQHRQQQQRLRQDETIGYIPNLFLCC